MPASRLQPATPRFDRKLDWLFRLPTENSEEPVTGLESTEPTKFANLRFQRSIDYAPRFSPASLLAGPRSSDVRCP